MSRRQIKVAMEPPMTSASEPDDSKLATFEESDDGEGELDDIGVSPTTPPAPPGQSPQRKRKPTKQPAVVAQGVGPSGPSKRPRTNTPWTAGEEQRLKSMRDAGNSWSEIAKTFPNRTEGSVKKHWYKDMHYAEFGDDERTALLAAIKEYDANKWKFIGNKVGKPAKACEQYAKEHFSNK